jgi:hypothetical protein
METEVVLQILAELSNKLHSSVLGLFNWYSGTDGRKVKPTGNVHAS